MSISDLLFCVALPANPSFPFVTCSLIILLSPSFSSLSVSVSLPLFCFAGSLRSQSIWGFTPLSGRERNTDTFTEVSVLATGFLSRSLYTRLRGHSRPAWECWWVFWLACVAISTSQRDDRSFDPSQGLTPNSVQFSCTALTVATLLTSCPASAVQSTASARARNTQSVSVAVESTLRRATTPSRPPVRCRQDLTTCNTRNHSCYTARRYRRDFT